MVAAWISEQQARRKKLEHRLRRLPAGRSEKPDPQALVAALIDLGDIVSVLGAPNDRKSKIYRDLGLRLTYHPGKHKVLVTATGDQDPMGYRSVSEGRVEPFAYLVEQGEQWLDLD